MHHYYYRRVNVILRDLSPLKIACASFLVSAHPILESVFNINGISVICSVCAHIISLKRFPNNVTHSYFTAANAKPFML